MPSNSQPHDALAERVYAELRELARLQLRSERRDHTLNATALVHEAWMKLSRLDGALERDRPAFFDAAAQAMRQILVDYGRTRRRVKRGGGAQRVDLEAIESGRLDNLGEILAVDEALRRLEAHDAPAARIVR